MPSDDIAISVRNLTKTYRLFGHPGDRIKQFLNFGLKQYHREFTAIQDVSFDIWKGESIGIIGRNGSGKSTLLQLICGILKPSSGTVQANGQMFQSGIYWKGERVLPRRPYGSYEDADG
jgi:lipopolysaccharide transport system ATP-binding protein